MPPTQFVTVHRAEEAPLLGGAGGGLILTRVLKPTPNPSKEGNKSVGFANKKYVVNAYWVGEIRRRAGQTGGFPAPTVMVRIVAAPTRTPGASIPPAGRAGVFSTFGRGSPLTLFFLPVRLNA